MPETATATLSAALQVERLDVYYGDNHVVHGVSLDVPEKRVVAFIGPSGCGKSTVLRCFNRMNDVIDSCRVEGRVTLRGEDVLGPQMPVEVLRKRVGMVFQKSNPFPMSIKENVTFGPRLAGEKDRDRLHALTEDCLRKANLLHEVKDRLDKNALDLSGGQQQRLCIARALAMEPEVLLMDEPCSALDPIATQQIEKLILELKEQYTIVIVTHNMQQAARVSDFTAFLNLGRLVEYGVTEKIFTNPSVQETEDYITGRFG